MATAAVGLLNGIRALDLTTNFTAYASKLLADLGADIIRVEPPSGDAVRKLEPLIETDDGGQVSAAHAFLNSNKKSITLDLSKPDGRRLFRDLVDKSDIVLESFSPGELAARGIGYEELRDWNPRIILVSITPYGQTGPRAAAPATDLTLMAAGGLLSLGGYLDTGPIAMPGNQAHLASAIFGAVGALSALLQRESTNHGSWVDVSGQECIAFALEDAIPEWYLNNTIRQRTGDRAREAGTGVYPCKDGYISLVAGRLGTAKAFTTLTQWIAAEIPAAGELLDPRWQDIKYRQSEEGIQRFAEHFNAFCATRSKQELYREGQARQIAIAPVNSVADVIANEQLNTNGFFRHARDQEVGRDILLPGPPYRMRGAALPAPTPAPTRGQHNRDVFVKELGLNEAEFGTLKAAGVI